jgi:hypothetical protein
MFLMLNRKEKPFRLSTETLLGQNEPDVKSPNYIQFHSINDDD